MFSYTYDLNGWLESVVNADGTPIESEADCAFPPTQADANLCTVTYYDVHGRREATQDPLFRLRAGP